MKLGMVLFIGVLLLLAYAIWRSDPAFVALEDGKLRFGKRGCALAFEVEVVAREREVVDELTIQRWLIRLSNGDSLYYEEVDLPPKEAFGWSYRAIVEGLFGFRVEEVASGDGFVIYRGDFAIALFYKSRHNLILLYPADDLMEALLACLQRGEQKPLLERKGIVPRKGRWKIEWIILDGLIEKNI
ncbi:MAG: hypothetical protein C6I00_07000 [Nitratiruptor sp.]|nr:hypothetical protein [Nitratiruptor sp.]NPA83784.1 hypothetical protein [Campylobacterota bacterium]